MHRRAAVVAAIALATGGCVDRLRDLAASTPRDLGVRSRSVDGNPLTDGRGVVSRPEELLTYAASFRSSDAAKAVVRRDAAATRAFVDRTGFVDGDGDSVLIVAQRLTAPEVQLRLGSVSRTGNRSLWIAVDEAGPRDEIETGDPVVKTLLLRLTDERGAPKRVIVSVDGDRAGVTV